jgi:hypothetical protein
MGGTSRGDSPTLAIVRHPQDSTERTYGTSTGDAPSPAPSPPNGHRVCLERAQRTICGLPDVRLLGSPHGPRTAQP